MKYAGMSYVILTYIAKIIISFIPVHSWTSVDQLTRLLRWEMKYYSRSQWETRVLLHMSEHAKSE